MFRDLRKAKAGHLCPNCPVLVRLAQFAGIGAVSFRGKPESAGMLQRTLLPIRPYDPAMEENQRCGALWAEGGGG
jgi:hypothetical protein